MKLRKIMAGVVASALAVSSLAIATSAAGSNSYTIEKGIFGVTSTSFVAKAGNGVMLAGDEGSEFAYIMDIPGGGPEDAESAESCQAVLEQNYDLWSKIDKVTVKFKLTLSADDAAAIEAEEKDGEGYFTMAFLQLGNAAGWKWNDSGSTPDLCKITGGTDEAGNVILGEEATVEFNPKAAIEAYGKTDPTCGVLKMGLTVGNNGIDDLTYNIEFTDLQIDGDQATIDKYTEIAKGIDTWGAIGGGSTTPDTEAPDTEAPDTEAPDTEKPADNKPVNGDSSKDNAGTGVESVAVVAGIAVLATGAVIVAKKRK